MFVFWFWLKPKKGRLILNCCVLIDCFAEVVLFWLFLHWIWINLRIRGNQCFGPWLYCVHWRVHFWGGCRYFSSFTSTWGHLHSYSHLLVVCLFSITHLRSVVLYNFVAVSLSNPFFFKHKTETDYTHTVRSPFFIFFKRLVTVVLSLVWKNPLCCFFCSILTCFSPHKHLAACWPENAVDPHLKRSIIFSRSSRASSTIFVWGGVSESFLFQTFPLHVDVVRPRSLSSSRRGPVPLNYCVEVPFRSRKKNKRWHTRPAWWNLVIISMYIQ